MPYKYKIDQQFASQKHYKNNAGKLKKRAIVFKSKAKKRNRDYVNDYLSTHPCVDCGESDIIVLEFDHVSGVKEIDISKAISDLWSIENLKNEIAKCEVRCANCHRRVTHQRRKKTKEKKDEIVKSLSKVPASGQVSLFPAG